MNIQRCHCCDHICPTSMFNYDSAVCDRCIIKSDMNFETAQQIIIGTYDGWMKYNEMTLNIAKDFVINHVDRLRWNGD